MTQERSLQDRVQDLEQKLAEAQAALKQTQEELELARLHLGAILKAVPAAVWIADRHGRVLIKSWMVDEIWGAGAPLPDKIEDYGAYRGWWADTGQPLQPEEWAMARAILKGETLVSEMIDIQRFDGQRRTILTSAAPLFNPEGQQVGAIAIAHDISQQRSLERDLTKTQTEAQERAKTLQAVLDTMTEPVLVYYIRADRYYANPSAVEMLGFDAGGMNRQTFLKHLTLLKLDRTPVQPEELASSRALRGERVQDERYLMIAAQGKESVIQTSSSPIYLENDLLGIVTVWTDITRQEQLLSENQRQKEFMERLMKVMPVGIAVVRGPDHRYEFANPYYRSMPVTDEQEILNRRAADVIPGSAAADAVRALDEVYRTEQTISIREYGFIMPGETERFLDIDLVPVTDEVSRVNGVIIVSREVTDQVHIRQQVEQQRDRLQSSNLRLELLSNAASQLLRGSDPNDLLENLYRQLSELVGLEVYIHYRLSEDGKHLELSDTSGLPESALPDLLQVGLGHTICGRAAKTRQPVVISDVQNSGEEEAKFIRKLGITAYACHPLIVQDRLMGTLSFGTREAKSFDPATLNLLRAVSGLVATAIDRKRTERLIRKSEAALRESEARLRLAQQVGRVGVLDWDLVNDRVIWSQELNKIYGYGLNEGEHFDWAKWVHPDDLEEFNRQVEQAASERRGEFESEYRIVLPNGEVRWLENRSNIFYDAKGVPTRSLGVSVDITGRKQIEETLKAYNETLERSNRELQQFAFMASHDMQEPLRKIEAFGDVLLKSGTNLDEQQRDYLERMRKAAGRMRMMVDDLLQLSRVTTHGKPFSRVDLAEIAAEVISDLDGLIERMGGTVSVERLPSIEADPVQMHQLLQNLIANGLKFHKPGESPRVRVYAKDSGPNVQIFVEDQGIGFDEQHLSRLFQPFVRLVGKNDYEGSGIGLAVCRKICERHGCEITARSTPGQGSTFIVTIPRKGRA